MALAVIVLMSAGLFELGLKMRRFSEATRLDTESRAFAQDRLEQIVAAGRDGLSQSSTTLMNTDTNWSSRGYPVIRTVTVVWHAHDGTVATSTNDDYAEVHVDAIFTSPLSQKGKTNTYSMLLE